MLQEQELGSLSKARTAVLQFDWGSQFLVSGFLIFLFLQWSMGLIIYFYFLKSKKGIHKIQEHGSLSKARTVVLQFD